MIGSRGEAAFRIKALKTAKLGAVEVGVVKIAAGFEDNDILPRCREHRGGRTSTGARADDANIAGQSRVALRDGDSKRAR